MLDNPVLDSLLSDHWYRVAELRPRLRPHLRRYRHCYRGRDWVVIDDPAGGRRHRLDPAGALVVDRFDGTTTLQQAWESVAGELGDDAPGQDEVINLLSALHDADLVQCELPADTADLLARGVERRRRQQFVRWKNPLAIRVPLLDPEALLQSLAPLARALFSPAGALLWLATVLPAVVLAAMHWHDLSTHLAGQVLAADHLLVALLVFVPVKLLHELGHGLAVKAGGGDVHEAGVLLLVLVPMPYVDASASGAFVSRRRRMIVAAAGVAVELVVAAFALYAWLLADDESVRALAWNLMLVAGLSTLLFNGNPLLRFDAYYVLSDWLEIPSLGSRSGRYLVYLLQRYLLGLRSAVSPAEGDDERGWLFCYGVASTAYRLVLTVIIALWLAESFPLLGAALALWAVGSQLALPLARAGRFLATAPALAGQRLRALCGTAALVTLVGGIAFVPLPLATVAQGVLWLPEDSQLRAAGDGFVTRVAVKSGSRVRAGETLLELADPLVAAERRVLLARRTEAEARLVALLPVDRVQAAMVRDELQGLAADLARNAERNAGLVVRAATDGVVWLARAQDLQGKHVTHGASLGWLLRDEPAVARIVVDQLRVGLVRERTDSVQIRLAGGSGPTMKGTVLRQVPAAGTRLPSAALGSSAGGAFAVDPSAHDGVTTLDPVFQFDVALPIPALGNFAGARLLARFDHGTEPLWQQWLRYARQVFLARLAL